MEETRLRRKNRESKRVKSYDGGAPKGRLEIQDKSRFKKRFSNKVPSKFRKSLNDRVSNLKSQNGKSTSYLPRIEFVESVARSIMVIDMLIWKIALGMARVDTRLGIAQILRDKTRVVGNLKLVVLIWILKRIITFMNFTQGVNKRVLPMW